jgi:hypothetical protein
MLEEFAAVQEDRTASLVSAHEVLKGSLGGEHPRVKALATALAEARGRQDRFAAMTARRAKQPAIGEHEWIVSGRVRTAAGGPAAGLRVRVFDKDRTKDDLLGDTRTDAEGDFKAVYHERDFAESGEGQLELYLQVEDAAGNLLFASRDQLRIQPGRVEYFDIVLPAAGPAAGTGDAAKVSPKGPTRTRKGRDG